MLGKLAGHSMFQGAALERLKMCGDCRVIDIYSAQDEVKITDIYNTMSEPIPVSSRAGRRNRAGRGLRPAGPAVLRASDAEMLDALRVAVTEAPAEGAFLEEPWRELVAAARAMTDEAVAREYQALFGGVGKPEVYLFGSHYLSGFLNEKPLARLRTDLAALGLARDEAMPETEDHIAYLCEVMRYLIAGDDVAVANLTRQSEFFAAHLQPWVPALCDAIAAPSQGPLLCRAGRIHPRLSSASKRGLRHAGIESSCRARARHELLPAFSARTCPRAR